MDEIFDLYGDILIAVVAAAAFFVFFLSLTHAGLLNQTIQMYGDTLCMKLCSYKGGYL